VALYRNEIAASHALARAIPGPSRHVGGRDHDTSPAAATAAAASRRILRILVVSPDSAAQDALRTAFEGEGTEVLRASGAPGVVDMVARAQVDLVVCDQQLADNGGFALLDAMHDRHPEVLTALLAVPGLSSAPQQASEHGASDYLARPVDAHEAVAFLRRLGTMALVREAAVPVPGAPQAAPMFRGMYGTTPIMRDVFRLISRVGRTDVTVLVTGESGTGKELVARALHDESGRRNKPFVALNCSALPSELVESELFGHTRGAFTGAVKDRGGLFEAAHGGTLFLDEIGDLGPLAQAKVLRALENGEVMRVGGTRSTHVDVRVVAATNRPLDDMVVDGRFREDLL
ncbi:MAG: sigma-54-dependent transcriptional regulator, partial [Gemmatimonas sp.]